MYEMSPYSTPILWRALVAGPVNGAVVASWRKTSRNGFSSGVSSLISRSPWLRASARVGLPDFLRRPIACVLGPGPAPGRVALQRSSRGYGLRRGPLGGLVRVPPYQGHAGRCRSDLSALKADRLPT